MHKHKLCRTSAILRVTFKPKKTTLKYNEALEREGIRREIEQRQEETCKTERERESYRQRRWRQRDIDGHREG